MNTTLKNPYVGPRTFQRADRDLFFGREREARDLLALAASERLVLFYAQSGAGKSSLLNTRLLPGLEGSNFEVLPVGRLQGDAPTGLQVENIYIFNLMSSMVQQKFSQKALAGLTLSQFLALLEYHEGGYLFQDEALTEIKKESRWPRILIIDQFEEIFTTHLAAWKKREDFFQQLAQAMQDDPYLTVMLIMREDYIASLDPYAHLLPGGLRMRYYMQRLSRDSALKAIKNPVTNLRAYAEGVAEKLVDDLAGITLQKPDGTLEICSGQYIEPVQLQVVCYGLWEDLPPGTGEITAKDLLEVGDVDQSLERFYNRRMAAVAREKNVPERIIREWFQSELITTSRTRNMILQNPDPKAKLRDEVILAMRGDLVRAELRAGQIWYELSHDRLIKPVLTSNTKWFEAHLSMFQQRVVLWAQQGKSDSLLLRDQELVDAEQEAAHLALTAEEQEFLEECLLLRKRIQRDRSQRRIIMVALIVSVILLAVALFLGSRANAATKAANNSAATAFSASTESVIQANNAVAAENTAQVSNIEALNQKSTAIAAEAEAKQQASIALSGSLVAQADALKNNDHALALLLGLEAYKRNPGDLTKTLLFNLLQFTAYEKDNTFIGVVNSAAVSEDGNRIAMASCKKEACNSLGEIRLFDAMLNQIGIAPGQYGIIYSLAFHQYPDKLVLAAGGCNPAGGCSAGQGQISLWEIVGESVSLIKQMPVHAALVKTIAFSADGKYLASGSYDKNIVLWIIEKDNLNSLKKIATLPHGSFVNEVTFSPDGQYLAAAGDDRAIYVWNISNPNNIPRAIPYKKDITAPMTSVAFNTDGSTLAFAGNNQRIYLWSDWKAGAGSNIPPIILPQIHTGYITSLEFNADGTRLASAGFDSQVIIWDTSDIHSVTQNGPALTVHTKAINQVVFGVINGQSYLISVDNDRTAIRWELYTRNPLSQYLEYTDPNNKDLISNPGNWGNHVCQAAQRNLTLEEWNQYLLNHTYEKTCPAYK